MNKLPDEFYILDTETTGLGESDEIVEIAILNQYGEAVLNTLIKPTQNIPDDAMDIHGITNEMVADAPTWDEITLPQGMRDFNYPIFIYNAAFDVRLWKQSCFTRFVTTGIPINFPPTSVLFNNAHCVMRMANEALNTERWVSLVAAAKHYGITFDGLTPHRAASDCAVTLDVLRAMHGLAPIATGKLARQYEVVR